MRLALAALALLTACGDETVSGYGALGRSFDLVEWNGAAAPAPFSLRFPAPGEVAGTGPCNTFSGRQTAPYPWFALSALAVTERACPELAAETALLAALTAMTLAEIAGDVLILSHTDGTEMVFAAR